MLHKTKRILINFSIVLAAVLLALAAAARPNVPDGRPMEPPTFRLSAQIPAAPSKGDETQDEEEVKTDAEEGTAEEKQPPEGALSATDILTNTSVIAHGMGAIGDLTTPNCLEGFLAQYAAGVRVFEADLRLTRDCQVILRHDWWHAEWQEGIDWANIPTREKFVSSPILGQYTPLSFRDLLLLMEEYPDICIITDSKFTDSDVFTLQFDAMLADAKELGLTYLFDRIMVQIYNTNMLTALNNIYPFPHYIYTLYQDGFNGTADALRERASFCAERGVEGITMESSLWKDEYDAIAKEYGIPIYVHTVNDRDAACRMLEGGVSGVYSDSLTPDDLAAEKLQTESDTAAV